MVGVIRTAVQQLTKALLGIIFKCGIFHYAQRVNIFILFLSLVYLPYCTSISYYSQSAINNKIVLFKCKWEWFIHFKITKFFSSTDGDIEIDEVDLFETVRHFRPPGGWINQAYSSEQRITTNFWCKFLQEPKISIIEKEHFKK